MQSVAQFIAVLRDAAESMRARALAAMNNSLDDRLCCWVAERVAGQEHVKEVRLYADTSKPGGCTDLSVIAMSPVGGVSAHIAGAHPRLMLLVAQALRREADRLEAMPAIDVRDKCNMDLYAIAQAHLTQCHD